MVLVSSRWSVVAGTMMLLSPFAVIALNVSEPLPKKPEQAGITFTNGKYCPNVTFASPLAATSLQRLESTGANFVAIVVTQYQKTYRALLKYRFLSHRQLYRYHLNS